MKSIFTSLLTIAVLNAFGQFSEFEPISQRPELASTGSILKTLDIDSDGDMDCIWYSGDFLDFYSNDGNFQWDLSYRLSIVGDANIDLESIMAEDFNSDGIMDLAYATYNWSAQTRDYKAFLNDGNFSFTPLFEHQVSIYVNPDFITTFHFNDDGFLDFHFGQSTPNGWNYGNVQSMLVFNGSEYVETSFTIDYPVRRVIDIDGDGDDDLIAESENPHELYCYLNDGLGNFDETILMSSIQFNTGTSYMFQNLDTDADLELIQTEWANNVAGASLTFYFDPINDPANFQIVALTENFNHPNQPRVMIDLNNDGYLDFMDGFNILYNNEGTSFSEPISNNPNLASAFAITSPLVIDADNDGDSDIVKNNFDQLILYRNNGSAIFNSEIIALQLASPNSNLVANRFDNADMNNDGKSDLVFQSFYPSVMGIFFGSEVDYSQPIILNTNLLLNYMHNDVGYIFDIHEDGQNEICYVNDDLQFCALTFNASGEANIEVIEELSALLPNTIYGYNFIHLNDDSYPDIVINQESTSILISNSSGDYTIVDNIYDWYGTGYSLPEFSTHDFNNDGMNDIVKKNMFNGIPETYLYDGSTFNLMPSLYDGPEFGRLEDFDGDGNIDVIAYDGTALVLYTGDDNGNFEFTVTVDPNAIYTEFWYDMPYAIADDVDNDGDNDIITYTITSDGMIELKQICTYLKSGSEYVKVDLQSQNVAHANDPNFTLLDVNGDNKKDLIVQNWYFELEIMVSFNIAESSYHAIAQAYYDMNADGIHQLEEPLMENISATINPSSYLEYSGNDGKINIILDELGAYEITINYDESLWQSTSSNTFSLNLENFEGSSLFEIGLTPLVVVEDVMLNIQCTQGVCGFNGLVWGEVLNSGTTTITGALCIDLPDGLTLVESLPVASSTIGNQICYDIVNLLPGQSFHCMISATNPTWQFMGTTFTSSATFVSTENTYSDECSYTLICAYDPNDIQELNGLSENNYVLEGQSLEYLIRFQNTGTAPAQTVVITDQLSELLDWQTMQPISSSHPMTASLDASGLVVFQFDNIMLPDSSADFAGSNGFVRFRILPMANLAPMTVIENTASIYFDFNPAVVTNTEITTIYDCTDLEQAAASTLEACAGESISFSNNATWIEELVWDFEGTATSGNNFEHTLNESGTMTMNVSNGLCEYTQSWELVANAATATFTSNGNTLSANTANTYQWFLNGNEIPNATSQTFEITQTGNYSVMITDGNGCSAMSENMLMTYTGVGEMIASAISIYPNPANQFVIINTQGEKFATLSIYDIAGRMAISFPNNNSSALTIPLATLEDGYYVLKADGKTIGNLQVIK
jgi:uncharacterized repeat protein (TIGR01451 family)